MVHQQVGKGKRAGEGWGLILPSGDIGQCPEAILLHITGRHLVSIGQ